MISAVVGLEKNIKIAMENKKSRKVLIIGTGDDSSLSKHLYKEQFGDDIILYTPEEAKAEGLTMNDFSNPIMKITEPLIPELPTLIQVAKSGKESRRERRKKARKSNKKNI